MSSTRTYEGESLYRFEGFIFRSHSENAMGSRQVQRALRSTAYIGAEHDARGRALANLAVLFKAMVYFMPYFSLPEFWEVVCDKWGLMEAYTIMRHLVHMCVFARGAFLAEENTTTSETITDLAELSALLASLVDTWRQVYSSKTYFDMREKAYEDPDENLRAQLGEAKAAWDADVLDTFVKQVLELLRHEKNSPSKPPRRNDSTTATDIDDNDDEKGQVLARRKIPPSDDSVDSEYVPDEEADQTPCNGAKYWDFNDTDGTHSKHLRCPSSRAISVGSTISPHGVMENDNDSDEFLDKENLSHHQPQRTHKPLKLSIRTNVYIRQPLFPNITRSAHSDDISMMRRSGGVFGDAEDYTMMNGKPLFSNSTLADMIRDHMKKEKDIEMKEDTEALLST